MAVHYQNFVHWWWRNGGVDTRPRGMKMRAPRGKRSSFKFHFEAWKWKEGMELTVGIKWESTQHLSLMARSPQGWIMKIMKLARKRLEWWLEFETPRDSMNSSILCTFSSFRNSSMSPLCPEQSFVTQGNQSPTFSLNQKLGKINLFIPRHFLEMVCLFFLGFYFFYRKYFFLLPNILFYKNIFIKIYFLKYKL